MKPVTAKEWRTLEPVLDALLDKEEPERSAYLHDVHGDNPVLLGRLLELLDACEHGARLLTAPVDTFAPLLRVPDVLGDRYSIVRELGHGGMATVYLADDAKHKRQVAVKVLDVAVAETTGTARFQREIEIAAQLHHPHILPLFDSGNAEGRLYFVMPCVEGESLRDRLLREKQLPIEDAVQIAREVADALSFAHRHGVVHRDIKPENILLHDSRSLVTDFGIATAMMTAEQETAVESSDVIGTPHYMSPEQATPGAVVNHLSDVYSLGVVLYEMLAGEVPHAGASSHDVLEKVIHDAVAPITLRRKSVPPHIAAVIAKATANVPADRFSSAIDFVNALNNSAFHFGEVTDGGVARRKRLQLAVAMTVLAVIATGTAGIIWSGSRNLHSLARFDITPHGESAMTPDIAGVEFTVSPNGARIVYVGEAPIGGTQLWQRTLDELVATPIPGSIGATSPAISPDGRLVAFNDGRGIKTALIGGGGSATLIDVVGDAPTWGTDGTLFYTRGRVVYRRPPSGEPAAPFTSVVEGSQAFPSALPDGRGLLVTLRRGLPDQSRIAVIGRQGQPIREILTGTMARFVPPNRIVWATASGALMSAAFDVKTLKVTGPAMTVLEGVRVKVGSASQFAVSAGGALLYQSVVTPRSDLVWVSRTGGVEPIDASWLGDFESPALSPNGAAIAIALRGVRSSEIWIKPIENRPASRLALSGLSNVAPSWTPDGRSLTVGWDSTNTNVWSIRTVPADGHSSDAKTSGFQPSGADPRWSPDGTWLVFRTGFRPADIFGIRSGIDTVPVPLVVTRADEGNPMVSPDGRWLSYSSNITGRYEIHVRPFPNTADASWVVSTSGGTEPLWSRNGRELFYRSAQRRMVAVSVSTLPTFAVDSVRVLFPESEFKSSPFRPQYDVTPDGQKFLMIRQHPRQKTGPLVLVLNFLQDASTSRAQ